jgi:class 3 adenylate cyclase/tetratricopeptide (TPR) repeat protein
VSIVFADLSGYTALAESLDPEEVYAFLRPTMTDLQGIVESFGGTVPQVQGDGFMAVFGVPVAHEDDAERSVRAALAVRDRVRSLNRGRRGVRLPEVHAGVNSGEVMVGPSDELAGFAVVGDTVNTASRLATLAPPGRVLVDETTMRHTAGAVRYGARRLRRAKGKAQPIATYEALGSINRRDAAPLRPFIDREEALALIGGELERAERDRRVRVLVVVGEPGIGKSRLALELGSSLQPGGLLVGRCSAFGEQHPLGALAEAVGAAVGLSPGDDSVAARDAIDRLARRIAPTEGRRAFASDLRTLLRIGREEAHRSDRDAALAARGVIEDAARRGPVVIVLDDLQRADEFLLGFLQEVREDPWPAPVLLLGLSREEPVGLPWAPISGLDPDSMRALGSLLLGNDVPAEAVELPVARANGNPLFLEETMGMLVETGVVRPEAGGWRVIDPAGLEAVPASIRLVIAARLDALPEDEKRLLQEASVCGSVTWGALLADVSDVADSRRALRGLVARDLLRRRSRSSVRGTAEYELKHALIRDVAYEALPRSERATRHLQIAEWIRGHSDETRSEPIGMLAYHYERAWELTRSRTGTVAPREVAARAADYLIAWAEHTFHGQARAAEPLFRRALRVIDADEQLSGQRACARASVGLAEALIEMGRHEEAGRQAQRARRLATRLGDDGLVGRALLALGRCKSDAGRMAAARALLRDAGVRFEAERDLRGQGWALHRLSETWGRADYGSELEALRSSYRLFVRARDRFGRAVVAQDLAYVLSVFGGAEFFRWFDTAKRLVDDEGDLRSRAGLLRSWGYFCFHAGRSTEAMRTMAEAGPLASEAGDRYAEADALLIGALAATECGDPAVAEAMAHEALDIGRELQSVRIPALARMAIARATLRLGRRDASARSLGLARAAIRRHRMRVLHADLAATEAMVFLDRGAWDEVGAPARGLEREERQDRVGLWRPLPALIRGRALLGAGRAREAAAVLGEAARLAREVGAEGTRALAQACRAQATLLSRGRSVRSSATSKTEAEDEAGIAAVAIETSGLDLLLRNEPLLAAETLDDAVERWQGFGRSSWLARALSIRAVALGINGDRARAAASLGRANAVLDDLGTPARNRSSITRPLESVF